MKITALATLLALTASASAQTITRTYTNHEVADESYVGLVLGTAQYLSPSGPDVTDGPFVTTTQYGGTIVGSRTYEADFVNNTSSPVVVDLGQTNPDSWFVIGSPSGCGTGFDSCYNNCLSWEGLATVAPNSTHTLFLNGGIPMQTFTSTQSCLFGASATAALTLDHSTPDADEIRWTSRLETTMFRTVKLSLNPNFTNLCTGAVPNSIGTNASIEWYGSHDAGTRSAAVLATDLPAATPAVCVMTTMHDPAPAGLGTVPVSCLRGIRLYQSVLWTDTAGTATFDLDLDGTTTGFSFYTQVIYRDQPSFGNWNSSNLLEGTAQ